MKKRSIICALVVAALLAGCTAVTTEEISESFRAMAVAGNKDFTCSIEDDVEMTTAPMLLPGAF